MDRLMDRLMNRLKDRLDRLKDRLDRLKDRLKDRLGGRLMRSCLVEDLLLGDFIVGAKPIMESKEVVRGNFEDSLHNLNLLPIHF